jgi:hypothetical protein
VVLVPPPLRTGEIEEHREIAWERMAAEQRCTALPLPDYGA